MKHIDGYRRLTRFLEIEDYAHRPRKRFKPNLQIEGQLSLNDVDLSHWRKIHVALEDLSVGRIHELAKLKSVVKKNLQALPQLPKTIIISGPPGIGKSHLALKLIDQIKFDWSIATTVVPDMAPNQLLWQALGFASTATLSCYGIFKLIVESLPKRYSADNPFKIAICFDEIHLFDKSQIRAIHEDIKSINTFCGTKGLIQLIFSGINGTFLPSAVNYLNENASLARSSCDWHVTNLQPFNRQESIALLHSALVRMHDGAETHYDNRELEHAISWLGGNLRLIEYTASSLRYYKGEDTASLIIKGVASLFRSSESYKLGNSHAMYSLIAAACLSQLPVRYEDELKLEDVTVKVSYLIDYGFVGFKPLSIPVEDYYTQATQGYLTLSMLELRELVSEFSDNSYFNVPLLMDPEVKWTWYQFKNFVAEMLNLRVRSFAILGKESVTLSNMFPDVLMSPSIEKNELTVSLTPEVMSLTNKCKDYASVKKYYESNNGQKMPDTAVFLNSSKAQSWDVAYAAKEHLQLVVKVNHMSNDDSSDTFKDGVIQDLKKMPANILCLYLTKNIVEDREHLRSSHKNLILVTRENLAAFLGLFSLTRFAEDI